MLAGAVLWKKLKKILFFTVYKQFQDEVGLVFPLIVKKLFCKMQNKIKRMPDYVDFACCNETENMRNSILNHFCVKKN